MHIPFLTIVILAVLSALLSVQLDRRFIRNRRLTQPKSPITQPPPEA